MNEIAAVTLGRSNLQTFRTWSVGDKVMIEYGWNEPTTYAEFGVVDQLAYNDVGEIILGIKLILKKLLIDYGATPEIIWHHPGNMVHRLTKC